MPNKQLNTFCYFLVMVGLIMMLASCTKSVPEDQFQKIKVIQSGELIEVYGYIPSKVANPWRYIVDVNVCGQKQRVTIDIPAGSTDGWVAFQSNCKYDGFVIVYDEILRQ